MKVFSQKNLHKSKAIQQKPFTYILNTCIECQRNLKHSKSIFQNENHPNNVQIWNLYQTYIYKKICKINTFIFKGQSFCLKSCTIDWIGEKNIYLNQKACTSSNVSKTYLSKKLVKSYTFALTMKLKFSWRMILNINKRKESIRVWSDIL